MAGESPWTYGTVTLEPPQGEPSPWTYGHRTLAYTPDRAPSAWAFGHLTLREPHLPIGVFNGTTVIRMPILAWDGNNWS